MPKTVPTPDVTTKVCTMCKQTLPLTEFWLLKGRPRPRCRQCHMAVGRLDRERAKARKVAEMAVGTHDA